MPIFPRGKMFHLTTPGPNHTNYSGREEYHYGGKPTKARKGSKCSECNGALSPSLVLGERTEYNANYHVKFEKLWVKSGYGYEALYLIGTGK